MAESTESSGTKSVSDELKLVLKKTVMNGVSKGKGKGAPITGQEGPEGE